MNTAMLNLLHELNTPLVAIERLARSGCDRDFSAQSAQQTFERISSYSGLARRLIQNARLFSALTESRTPQANMRTIQVHSLCLSISELLHDHEVLSPQARVSGRMGSTAPRSMVLRTDKDILLQAVSIVVDNAFRYSYRDSHVEVSLAANDQRLLITVKNKGLSLSPAEVPLATTRGWRSAHAQAAAVEGAGNGLWIASVLLQALYGELVICPTNAEGITTVTITLPFHNEDSIN